MNVNDREWASECKCRVLYLDKMTLLVQKKNRKKRPNSTLYLINRVGNNNSNLLIDYWSRLHIMQ